MEKQRKIKGRIHQEILWYKICLVLFIICFRICSPYIVLYQKTLGTVEERWDGGGGFPRNLILSLTV